MCSLLILVGMTLGTIQRTGCIQERLNCIPSRYRNYLVAAARTLNRTQIVYVLYLSDRQRWNLLSQKGRKSGDIYIYIYIRTELLLALYVYVAVNRRKPRSGRYRTLPAVEAKEHYLKTSKAPEADARKCFLKTSKVPEVQVRGHCLKTLKFP